jgi:hypothetical protein
MNVVIGQAVCSQEEEQNGTTFLWNGYVLDLYDVSYHMI